jgi:hypothetical protein
MDDKLNPTGRTYDHWMHSALAFSVIINLVTYKIFVEISYWNVVSVGAAILSLIIYYAFLLMFSVDPVSPAVQNQLYGVFVQLFESPQPVYILVVVPIILLAPDMFFGLL